jgi:branched-chain amino acid transport system substrate-binding protein
MSAWYKRHAFVGAVAIWAGFASVPEAHAQSEVKIGYNGDQSSGGTAEFGISGRYGFEAAIEDLNAQGGILGRKVVGVIRDDQGTPPKSIQNMNELIDSEQVAAVIGPTNSGNAMAWLHIPQQKKIPVITHVATGSAITVRYANEPQNYIFRVSLIDRDQVALLLAYAVKATKGDKIGIIADSSGYGQGVSKDALEILDLYGKKPVAVEKFSPRDTDMTSQLLKLRDAGVDVLIAGSLSDANGHLLKSMEKIGYFPILLGTWGNGNSPVPNIAGKALAERIYFIASATQSSSPTARALYDRLITLHPTMTSFDAAAQAYDSAMLLAAAMKQANAVTGEPVQQALENLDRVNGVIKSYVRPFSKTNHEGLGATDLTLARWKDGKVVALEDETITALKPSDIKH